MLNQFFETFENLNGFPILQIGCKFFKNGAKIRLPEPNLLSNIDHKSRVADLLEAHYEVITRDIILRAHLTTLHSGDFEDL